MSEIRSVFEDASAVKQYPRLKGKISADVAIIGGGITGITAAYLLAKQGKKVVVLEAHQLGKGATGNSTGNLYATVGNKGLQAIKSKFGTETMTDVVRARRMAVDFIANCVQEHSIDCDFKRISWSLFSDEEKKKSYIGDEKEAAAAAGLPTEVEIAFPLPVVHGFSIPGQAQFNPYKYIVALAASITGDCAIYEHTKVTSVEEADGIVVITTEHGKVITHKAIMATHTPKGIYLVHSLLGPYREYAVAATLNGEYPPDGTFWKATDNEHYSMRTYDSPKGKVLMVLGEIHKVGQKQDNDECFKRLEHYLRENFDVATIEYRWAAQQYKPADTLPYIGTVSDDSNIHIATGFSADGLTYGTMAAMIISDLIAGRNNDFAKIFDPKRHTPLASAGEAIKENLNVAAQYIKDIPYSSEVDKASDVTSGEGKIIEVDGEKYGAYRHENGSLHVVSAVCTHMKCIVAWNRAEKSWDCPCHGSRFSYCGEVIEGPAIADLPKMSETNKQQL
ncbi:MAG TPA: FAD-dependent oxidoreductase [Flavobacterium sp.]|jgi:glycine/D-amino acid oxidase-like deaminating enzyme/nitrite reductase/ring-hydroxylating ferredoxin subunit